MVDVADVTPKEADVQKRKRPSCPYCHEQLEYRISRGMLVKVFLFWWPSKRFRCFNCKQSTYVWERLYL